MAPLTLLALLTRIIIIVVIQHLIILAKHRIRIVIIDHPHPI
jgi:hypothetical protein